MPSRHPACSLGLARVHQNPHRPRPRRNRFKQKRSDFCLVTIDLVYLVTIWIDLVYLVTIWIDLVYLVTIWIDLVTIDLVQLSRSSQCRTCSC